SSLNHPVLGLDLTHEMAHWHLAKHLLPEKYHPTYIDDVHHTADRSHESASRSLAHEYATIRCVPWRSYRLYYKTLHRSDYSEPVRARYLYCAFSHHWL